MNKCDIELNDLLAVYTKDKFEVIVKKSDTNILDEIRETLTQKVFKELKQQPKEVMKNATKYASQDYDANRVDIFICDKLLSL